MRGTRTVPLAQRRESLFTGPGQTSATVDVDLSRNRLNLPVSLLPGAMALPEATVAARVTAPGPAITRVPDRAGDRWTTFR